MNKKSIVEEIKNKFIEEAERASLLFRDLSEMENYISESYSGRSLIELLQNADDAKSTCFIIKKYAPNIYIVANNGLPFSNDDFTSLCRSGASTKIRKNSTIGYRGIGFKSIVSYAKVVHILSGEVRATFSRELTLKESNSFSKVPLIRIPHLFKSFEYNEAIHELKESGYNTFFIFETDKNTLEQEILSFDSSCLLFLNSVSEIIFEIEERVIFRIKHTLISSHVRYSKLYINSKYREWITHISHENRNAAISFEIEQGKAKKLDRKESVIHSFMPTLSENTLGLKINADFSTDPSRTRVVLDNDSCKAAKICSKILADMLCDILRKEKDQWGILSLLHEGHVSTLSSIKGDNINDFIIKTFHSLFLHNYEVKSLDDIFIQPIGISDEDFNDIITELGSKGIDYNIEQKLPCALSTFKSIGIKELPLNLIIKLAKKTIFSESTRIKIIVDIIKEGRFLYNLDFIHNIRTAKLFTFNNKKIEQISEVKSTILIDDNFEGAILSQIGNEKDFLSFCDRIGIKQEQLNLTPKEVIYNSYSKEIVSNIKATVIQKWRSVEENVANIFRSYDNVLEVYDVSRQNIGYDLKVIYSDASEKYIEVKSVKSLGETIRITNNEYATGNQLGENYILIVVEQTKSHIKLCIINNPISKLKLEKQAVQWLWINNNYEGDIISFKIE